MKNIILLLIALIIFRSLFAQQLIDVKIIQKPINYNQQRKNLSVEYLKQRHGLVQNEPTITPTFIVLHYTAGGSINSTFKYFNNIQIENARTINKNQSTLNVSSHYLVDRDGTIYQLVPDNLLARHTIGLNYTAIGVENIGSKTQPLTAAQVTANASLIRYLCGKHKIEFVIGHSEYIRFRNTKYWKETNPKYITFKDDPGNTFLVEVRKLIKDLKVKDSP